MSPSEQASLEPVADVEAQRIAQVYAEALLNAAERQGQADAVLEELEAVVREVFRAEPRFEAFLGSGAIGRERKAPVIRSVFETRGSKVFANFLQVLNAHDRLDLLRPILRAARDLADVRARRVRVQVRSAVPLPDAQRERLLQDLRKELDLEPLLEAEVDPDLLGGLVVRVGDWVYDATVRTRLESLRKQLIERSSHEIQSGRDRFRSADGD
jgi:F-type H+-transporting ATPase subunit delta